MSSCAQLPVVKLDHRPTYYVSSPTHRLTDCRHLECDQTEKVDGHEEAKAEGVSSQIATSPVQSLKSSCKKSKWLL